MIFYKCKYFMMNGRILLKIEDTKLWFCHDTSSVVQAGYWLSLTYWIYKEHLPIKWYIVATLDVNLENFNFTSVTSASLSRYFEIEGSKVCTKWNENLGIAESSVIFSWFRGL